MGLCPKKLGEEGEAGTSVSAVTDWVVLGRHSHSSGFLGLFFSLSRNAEFRAMCLVKILTERLAIDKCLPHRMEHKSSTWVERPGVCLNRTGSPAPTRALAQKGPHRLTEEGTAPRCSNQEAELNRVDCPHAQGTSVSPSYSALT